MQSSYPQSNSLSHRKSSLGDDTIPCPDLPMEDDSIADPALLLIIADDGSVGDDSMNSSEENDVIDDRQIGAQINVADLTVFRQVDYLWIFDPFVNFKQRKNFVLDDSSLSLDDYNQMRQINRSLLTFFM